MTTYYFTTNFAGFKPSGEIRAPNTAIAKIEITSRLREGYENWPCGNINLSETPPDPLEDLSVADLLDEAKRKHSDIEDALYWEVV